LLFGLQEQAAKEALAARDVVQEAKKVNAFVQSNFLCTLHICLPY
jgi:hypothetical protein